MNISVCVCVHIFMDKCDFANMVLGNGYGDLSSNFGRRGLLFTFALRPWVKV